MKNYLFVYGTLLPNKAPAEIAGVVRRLRRIGRAHVRGRLYDFGEYPGAVINRSGRVIEGLLFELPQDPRILKLLDRYEGYKEGDPKRSLFVRRRRLVTRGNRKIRSWIYEYNFKSEAKRSVA